MSNETANTTVTLPEVSAAERKVTDAVHSGHVAIEKTIEAQAKI
jgi:hypothetical protein